MTKSDPVPLNEGIDYRKEGGLATLTLNRPQARNAISCAMFVDLERCLIDIASDSRVKAVLLTGANGLFSAGADLKPMSEEESEQLRQITFPGDGGGALLERSMRCVLRLYQLPKPVIASLSGNTLGIAASLSLAADLRIAGDDLRMGFIFSNIGLGPDGGASWFLRHLLGPAKALELLYFAEILHAEQALELGLVNRVVAVERLQDETLAWAERLVAGPSMAYAMAKSAVQRAAESPLESILDLEARNQVIASRSDDLKEGIQAFIERRKPIFKGY